MSQPPISSQGSGASTAEATKHAAKDTAAVASDQASAVAGSAAGEVRDVADQAKEQLATVTSEARDQARKVVGSATSELTNQMEQRLIDAAGSARTTAHELQALADGKVDEAGRTGDLVRDAGVRLERFAERVDQLGVRGVTEEVTDFARRRPAAFLFSAAVMGVVVGRLARASKESSDGTTSSTASGSASRNAPPHLGQGPTTPSGDVLIDIADPALPLPGAAPVSPPISTPPTIPGAVAPPPRSASLTPPYGTAREAR